MRHLEYLKVGIVGLGMLSLANGGFAAEAKRAVKEPEPLCRYAVTQIEFVNAWPGESEVARKEVLRIDQKTGEASVLKLRRQGGQWEYYWVEVEQEHHNNRYQAAGNALQL